MCDVDIFYAEILLSACLKCTAEREWKKCEGKWATMIQGETCRQYAMYKWKIRDGRGVGGYSVGMHVEFYCSCSSLSLKKLLWHNLAGPVQLSYIVDENWITTLPPTNINHYHKYIEIHWVHTHPMWVWYDIVLNKFVLLQYIDITLSDISNWTE